MRDHLYYADQGEDGLEAHQVNQMLLAGASEPDYEVDISAHVETKLEAVLCHRSQIGGRNPEEMRRRWQERMRSAQNGRITESVKRVQIRPSTRQQQAEQQEQPNEQAAATPTPTATPTPR